MQSAPQDIQLMSMHAVLSPKPFDSWRWHGPSNGRDDAAGHGVDQLLRKALAVLDDSGTADGFDNLAGVRSWIKSLRASVSNGLRSTLILRGAEFAASL